MKKNLAVAAAKDTKKHGRDFTGVNMKEKAALMEVGRVASRVAKDSKLIRDGRKVHEGIDSYAGVAIQPAFVRPTVDRARITAAVSHVMDKNRK